jgi:hypothetical protein
MGVDCLSPTYDLLDRQIDPRQSSLVQLTVGSGYRAFKDDIQSWYKINRSMQSNIKAPSGLPVKMDVGVNSDRRSESRVIYKCEGEMVHTRTIRFVIGVPTEIGGSTMDWSKHEQERNRLDRDSENVTDAYAEAEDDEIGALCNDTATDPASLPLARSELPASRSISLRPSYSSQTSRTSLQQTGQSRLDLLLESKTQLHLTDKQNSKDADKIQREMVDICMDILKNENRGATHFVSSIDLGAKVFYTETSRQTKSSSKVSVKAGIDYADSGASGHVSSSGQSVIRSLTSGTTATIHPEVNMQTIKTIVTPQQEKMIGCEVSPVWLLVQDRDWRQAMKHACWVYVKEHIWKSSFPMISKGGPFNIASGHCFLTVREDAEKGYVLEGTKQRQDASLMYIEIPHPTNTGSSTSDQSNDPLRDPDFGFYIYYSISREKRSGIKLYLCADPSDETTIRLVTRIPSHNSYSRLYVECPSTQTLAPLSQWAKEPLHLLRKTAYMKRRQYVVMRKESSNPTRMKLVFSSEPHREGNLQSLCQFAILKGDYQYGEMTSTMK